MGLLKHLTDMQLRHMTATAAMHSVLAYVTQQHCST